MPSKPTQGKAEADVQNVVKTYDPGAFARAAGSIHEEAARQYARGLQSTEVEFTKGIGVTAQGGAAQITRNTLRRLTDAKILSQSETEALERILTLLDDKTAPSNEVRKVSVDVYNKLVRSKASPCAIALAGIAKNSIKIAIEVEHTKGKADEGKATKGKAKKNEVNWWHILGADLAGAGTGALAGAGGGPLGIIGGAIAGAAVGSGGELIKSQ
jgi:hypothetical protein